MPTTGRSVPPRSGHNYAFLNIQGKGHYVGTVLNIVQTQISWFGEGDDLFYMDGAKHPQLYGTGRKITSTMPGGCGFPTALDGHADGGRRAPGSRLTAYRWHVPDPIPFTSRSGQGSSIPAGRPTPTARALRL